MLMVGAGLLVMVGDFGATGGAGFANLAAVAASIKKVALQCGQWTCAGQRRQWARIGDNLDRNTSSRLLRVDPQSGPLLEPC